MRIIQKTLVLPKSTPVEVLYREIELGWTLVSTRWCPLRDAYVIILKRPHLDEKERSDDTPL